MCFNRRKKMKAAEKVFNAYVTYREEHSWRKQLDKQVAERDELLKKQKRDKSI